MRKLTKRERILLGTALVLYAGFFAWQGMVLPARVSLETAVRRKEQLEKLLEESPKAEAAAGGQPLPGRKLEPEEADAILQKLAEDTGDGDAELSGRKDAGRKPSVSEGAVFRKGF